MHALDLDGTVRHVVATHLEIAPEKLTGDLPLVDLGLDDDCAFDLLVAVEEELDVRFPDDFFDGVTTYGDLTTAVRLAVGP